ncbi:MAG TPA: hypothetical protein VGI39_21875 [Polyangiaceae bacterium]
MKETAWIWAFVATFAAGGCAAGTTDDLGPGGSVDDGGQTPVDAGELDGGGGNAMPLPVGEDAGGSASSAPDTGAPVTNDDAGTPSTPDAGSGGGDDAGSTPDTGGGGPGPVPDSGGGTGSGTPPTSCTAANQAVGCCLNDVLYYCNGGTSVTQKACTSGKVCGWSALKSYYDCVTPPATSDPNGTYPLDCP